MYISEYLTSVPKDSRGFSDKITDWIVRAGVTELVEPHFFRLVTLPTDLFGNNQLVSESLETAILLLFGYGAIPDMCNCSNFQLGRVVSNDCSGVFRRFEEIYESTTAILRPPVGEVSIVSRLRDY